MILRFFQIMILMLFCKAIKTKEQKAVHKLFMQHNTFEHMARQF